MAATKQPSGLGIEKTAYLAFKCSWKLNDADYGAGHQMRWRLTWSNGKTSAWTTVACQPATRDKKVTLTASDYYPSKTKYIKNFTFQVRGKRNPTTQDGKTTNYDWSKWSEKVYSLYEPPMPKMSAALDPALDNVSTFTWTTNADNKGHYPFYDNQWQTMLVRACKTNDGSQLTWSSGQLEWEAGTAGANSSKTITEDSVRLANDSYTRWMRIRARGAGDGTSPKGASNWRYAKHVFARPYPAKITKVSAAENTTGITTASVTWTAATDAAHPIDSTLVQWTIDTPVSGLLCPSTASWNDGPVLRDTYDSDKATFTATSAINQDQAMWVRIVTRHDRNSSYSDERIVNVGKLTDPSGLSVATDPATFRATITATNNSAVPDSALAVLYRSTNVEPFVIGVIPAGSSSVTVQCPDWTGEANIDFGVYAFQGTATAKTRDDGVGSYAIDANMKSSEVWDNGSLPQAPTGVTAEPTTTEGEVLLNWNWTWTDADMAELSWSTNPNAWESTDEPQTYTLTNIHAAQWRVSGLSTGEIWYFRIRLGQQGEDITFGPYSEAVPCDLSSAPSMPVLTLSEGVIPADGTVTAQWSYESTDGSQQAFAEVCEATVSGSVITYGSVIAVAESEQHVSISAAEAGWTIGNYYYLAVRVRSESNHTSVWSDPVPVLIADAVVCTITSTSLQQVSVTDDDGEVRTVDALTAMPLTADIAGAGDGGTTTLIIQRRDAFQITRPDESVFHGYAGETIVSFTQTGEDQIEITREMLVGSFDMEGWYTLTAIVEDTYGQTDSASIDFQVRWAHMAVDPVAAASIDGTNLIARLTPTAPVGYVAGDTVDIYRLSQDAPVLVIEGGAYGTEYVDPYPTIGETGGYRFVHVTEDGNYIKTDEAYAWIDVEAGLDIDATIINFEGRQVVLEYDLEVSHSWDKDFTETTYLGGAIQGDWNLAVHRSVSVSANSVVIDDPVLIGEMRRLAAYPGICHVRTVDGSTFAADVQVSESRAYDSAGKIAVFSISIKQVDPQELDGITYAEWSA